MVMKDKLVKTNHKGSYYVMKKLSIALLAVASVSFVIAVPTYIVQTSKNKNTVGLAEEETSQVVESNSSEEEQSYETYNG